MSSSLFDKFSFHLTTQPAQCKEWSERALHIGPLLLVIHNPKDSLPWGRRTRTFSGKVDPQIPGKNERRLVSNFISRALLGAFLDGLLIK